MRLHSSSLVVLIAIVAAGCNPRCERTCRKVLSCDLSSERVSQFECVEQCDRQDILYELWEDEDKQQAFKEHKRCLLDKTCAQIEAGACYDDLLFIVDEPG